MKIKKKDKNTKNPLWIKIDPNDKIIRVFLMQVLF